MNRMDEDDQDVAAAKVQDLSPYDFNLNRGGLMRHCLVFLLVEYRS